MSIEWISHRGLQEQSAIENTQRAFDQAIAAGFKSLETDLRITQDNHIVLCHDRNLKRIANLPIDVHLTTKAELQKVRLPDQSRLLFFEDLLLQYLSFQWTLEIKPDFGDKTIERLIEICERDRLEDWVSTNVKFLVSTQQHEQRLKERFPQARFYARYAECKRVAVALLLGFGSACTLDPNKIYGLPTRFLIFDFCQSKYLDYFRGQGVRLLAYLPANDDEALAAATAGFDEVLTDRRIVSSSKYKTSS